MNKMRKEGDSGPRVQVFSHSHNNSTPSISPKSHKPTKTRSKP